MPLYDYRCNRCATTFETLVMGGEAPTCPACGTPDLERLIGLTAAPPTYQRIIKAARAQAQREGHMSNYSAATQQRLRRGQPE